MKQKILFFLVLVLLVGAYITYRVFKNASASVENEKVAYTVSVIDLVSEFENDENLANSKYLNKVIEVTGTIEKIETKDNTVNIYLSEENSTSNVICGFDAKMIDKLNIIEGQSVKVKGLCTGYLFDVVLNKCAVIP